MKPLAVLDSSVVVSGIGWRTGDSRSVLRLLAMRDFLSVRTLEFIVTKDPDLLGLGKPFGIRCVTPRSFLSAVSRRD